MLYGSLPEIIASLNPSFHLLLRPSEWLQTTPPYRKPTDKRIFATILGAISHEILWMRSFLISILEGKYHGSNAAYKTCDIDHETAHTQRKMWQSSPRRKSHLCYLSWAKIFHHQRAVPMGNNLLIMSSSKSMMIAMRTYFPSQEKCAIWSKRMYRKGKAFCCIVQWVWAEVRLSWLLLVRLCPNYRKACFRICLLIQLFLLSVMQRWGISRHDALTYVRGKRTIVNPNRGFRKQLDVWGDCGYDVYRSIMVNGQKVPKEAYAEWQKEREQERERDRREAESDQPADNPTETSWDRSQSWMRGSTWGNMPYILHQTELADRCFQLHFSQLAIEATANGAGIPLIPAPLEVICRIFYTNQSWYIFNISSTRDSIPCIRHWTRAKRPLILALL